MVTAAKARHAILLLGATVLCSCAVASAPIQKRPAVVPTPEPGFVGVSAQSADAVGGVEPVFISVANGTDIPRRLVPAQVFAINEVGERVAPVPPGEAARESGDAGELSAALKSGVASGVVGGAVGAGIGAAAGSAFNAVGRGAALGGAIGGAEAIFEGVPLGTHAAHREANQQIRSLALRPATVMTNFTASGYVFFPKGNYREVEVLLVNQETRDTEQYRTALR